MKTVIRLGGTASSALCVLMVSHLPSLASGQAASAAAEAGWAKMTQCAAIGDDEARHACTDAALREAGLLTDEAKARARRKAFGLQQPAPVAAAPAPETTASAAPQPKEETQHEHIDVKLAKVEQGGDGKLVLTTTDGAVWHQVESGPVRRLPKTGQTMKIEARSLGGFMCLPSKYVSFRCYRSK